MWAKICLVFNTPPAFCHFFALFFFACFFLKYYCVHFFGYNFLRILTHFTHFYAFTHFEKVRKIHKRNPKLDFEKKNKRKYESVTFYNIKFI